MNTAGKYRCEDCGAIFNEGEQEQFVELHDEHGVYFKYIEECPCCQSHEYYAYGN